ncbi:MAG: acetate--CoA ligase family protein, partial [Gemmatimonadetes bacterium]|nr:acetate--CoA ligase family protein [Gemmatimonadota bacterium]
MARTLPLPRPAARGRETLDPVLRPRTIAVVGASRSRDTIGHKVLANLVDQGFTGAVYPVNPRAAAIRSMKAYPTVGAIPDPVDMAVVCVPKEHVLEVAEDCGRAGVRGLVVISAGFCEVGPEGAARERELLAIVRRHGMRMVGPNCMGVLNADPRYSMNATFAPAMPPFGGAGFVSQSGALGLSVLDYAREYGIGISQFVSIGNKPDVSGNDVLEYWEDDPTIEVILMYVENFGNPRRFLEIASRITKRKPIVVVKSGRSAVGARAATSHTGALAASDLAVGALLEQAGVLRAASIEELFDTAMAFGSRSLPRSRRTAVLTNSGGPGILAADALEHRGLDVVELAPSTTEALRPLFPAEASLRNPLDMIASATPAGYRAALAALLGDDGVDAALAIFVPPLGVRQEEVAEAIVAAAATRPDKPVLAVLMGREGLPAGRAELHRARIPAYIFPESAARALAALNRQREWTERPVSRPRPLPGIDVAAARAIVDRALAEGRASLRSPEALELLAAYGIPITAMAFASSEDDAVAAATRLGFPVVMKVVSGDIEHKTDVGGVEVGIPGPDDARRAYRDLLARVAARVPGARIDGVLVQRMIRGGIETIAGINRERLFGPLLMFGLGGIYVEALRDVVFRVAPIGTLDADDMLAGIRAARILQGTRGRPPADRAALADALLRLSQLAVDIPEIQELDANPLLAFEHGIVAVDARVRVAREGE